MHKGYIVEIDGIIWGSAPTCNGAWRDAEEVWKMPEDPEEKARCHPATGRLLAMIDLMGASAEWHIKHDVACYYDEVIA